MTSSSPARPFAIVASSAPPRTKPSNYPEPFFSRMAKREKRPLGDLFGLKNFGVNLTRLAPGGESALLHRHSKQDEFVYVLEGEPTLVTETEEVRLSPGMCAGFPVRGIARTTAVYGVARLLRGGSARSNQRATCATAFNDTISFRRASCRARCAWVHILPLSQTTMVTVGSDGDPAHRPTQTGSQPSDRSRAGPANRRGTRP